MKTNKLDHRRQQRATAVELLAWISILVGVAAIIAVIAYDGYMTKKHTILHQQEYHMPAPQNVKAYQVVPSWETKEVER